MPINLGSTSIGSLYLGRAEIGSAYLGNVKIYEYVPPLNPLNLPAKTLRIKFENGFTPSVTAGKGSAVQVSSSPNVWDITYDYDGTNSWYRLSYNIGPSSDRVKIQEILGANGTGITNMSQIFYNCSNLTSVSLFDTSSATTMNSMFRSCSLTSVPLFNTSSATNLGSMFSGCSSLTSVPLFNTSSATNMAYMFNGCSTLTSVPLFNTSSATNMSGMLQNCSSLTSVPLFDTSVATDMSSMCNSCSSITSVPLFDTGSCDNMMSMFYSCTNVASGALALYQQASTQATPPSIYVFCFKDCGSNTVTGAAELAQIPEDWGGTLVSGGYDPGFE